MCLVCLIAGGVSLFPLISGGPSGCGKTLLAAALAHEAGAQFIALSLADLLQSDVGASEQVFFKLIGEKLT